jgi:hypothetical protein
VNLARWIRRLWSPERGLDHPLSATERDEDQPQTSFDERARVIDDYVGDDFDPDESARG